MEEIQRGGGSVKYSPEVKYGLKMEVGQRNGYTIFDEGLFPSSAFYHKF